ncbi:hypothetical protein CPC08DRAFT_725942 [Agrocybe pediades]|nr:hypothetical protein CPC08DRAFT_725942 [Agrocybe pediades]
MLAIQAFLSAFFSFLIFSAGIHAATSVSNVGADGFAVRSVQVVPTVAEVKTHLKVPPDTSLFYSADLSNQGTCKQAKDWAKLNHPTYKVLAQLWIDPNYPAAFQADVTTSKQFFDVASQAMAELSSGTVYAVLCPWVNPDGKDWYAGSVWARVEWPALLANANVKTVVRINSATGAEIKIKG